MSNFECTVCLKRFVSQKNLEKHYKQHEGKGNPSTAVFKFHCGSCLKSFKSVNGLEQHVLVHGGSGSSTTSVTPEVSSGNNISESRPHIAEKSDAVDEWPDANDLFPEEPFLDAETTTESHLDEFDYEIESHLEEEEARILGASADDEATNSQKKEKGKTSVKKRPLVTCPKCKHSFYSVEGYINHQGGHAFKDLLTSKAPDLECVLQSSDILYEESLQELQKIQPSVGKGPEIERNAAYLITVKESESSKIFVCHRTKCLYDVIGKTQQDTFMLPSELRTAFTKGSAKVLSDLDLRGKLLPLLCDLFPEQSPAISLMLPCIIRLFSIKLITFILRCLVGNHVRFSEITVNTSDNTKSLEFRQNIHYIGGANVKSVLDTARRYQKNNDEWKRVISVIKNNFIVSDSNTSPPVEVMEWTAAQNRGGLLVLNDAATNLFVKLAEIVKPLEKLDGSVLTDEAFQKVCSSPELLILWDTVIQGSILKEEAFKLLHAICSHFCVTWRNGVISRRMDALQGKKKASQQGKGGVAFRAGL